MADKSRGERQVIQYGFSILFAFASSNVEFANLDMS